MKRGRTTREYSNTLEYISVCITFKIREKNYFLKHNPDIIATDDSAGNDIINAISNTQTPKNVICSTVLLDFMRQPSFSGMPALLVTCVG